MRFYQRLLIYQMNMRTLNQVGLKHFIVSFFKKNRYQRIYSIANLFTFWIDNYIFDNLTCYIRYYYRINDIYQVTYFLHTKRDIMYKRFIVDCRKNDAKYRPDLWLLIAQDKVLAILGVVPSKVIPIPYPNPFGPKLFP